MPIDNLSKVSYLKMKRLFVAVACPEMLVLPMLEPPTCCAKGCDALVDD